MRHGIHSALGDVQSRYEITSLLKELTVDIEMWDRENALIDSSNELLQVSMYHLCPNQSNSRFVMAFLTMHIHKLSVESEV